MCNPDRSDTNLAAVLKELSGGRTPTRVICCGHSLGGALATLGEFTCTALCCAVWVWLCNAGLCNVGLYNAGMHSVGLCTAGLCTAGLCNVAMCGVELCYAMLRFVVEVQVICLSPANTHTSNCVGKSPMYTYV